MKDPADSLPTTRAERRAAAVSERGRKRRQDSRARPGTFLHRLLYVLSLPERLVRSAAGWIGAAGVAVARLLPGPLRGSRFYRFVVERQLKLLCDDLGGTGRFAGAKPLDSKTAVRLGVGGALDNAAILSLHCSPLWIILAAKDVADGARGLVGDIVKELKDQGLVEPGSRIDKTDELLGALAKLSERAGDTLDCPPLRPEDLRATLKGLKERLAEVGAAAFVDVAQLDRLANDVRRTAAAANRPLFDVMTSIAVAAAQKSESLAVGASTAAAASVRSLTNFVYDGVVLDYQKLLDEALTKGLHRMLSEHLAPNLRATRRWFAFDRLTKTESLFTRDAYAHTQWARRRTTRS